MGSISKKSDHIEVSLDMEDLFKDRTPLQMALYRLGWHMLTHKAPKLADLVDKAQYGNLELKDGQAVVTFYTK